jgi:DNA-directed RNA polymerase I, II, and III subunit RPABC2
MSYFEGDSDDDDKKFKGSDDDDDSGSETETVMSESDVEEANGEEIYGGVGDYGDDDEYIEEANEEDGDEEAEVLEDAKEKLLEEDYDGEEIVEKKDTAKTEKRTKKLPTKQETIKKPLIEISDDETDDDETGEGYLQKFDKEINDNYLVNFHPECVSHNYDEVIAMSKVVRDENGIIIDDFHKTIPFMTKFEKARVLGQRAKQINSGATPFVKVPENVIDGYLIAELELKQKRVPFIIRRPLPNGGSEYWSIKDLEDISF